MNGLIKGAVAGFLATIPMTLAMKAMHAQLPREERYPLPPRLIVENTAEKLEFGRDLREDDKFALTVASHFAYGSATGAIYGAGIELQGFEPSVASGVAYGLGVWTVSYLGLLPGLGILTSATAHSTRRNALMIGAHVVWGAALGAAVRRLD